MAGTHGGVKFKDRTWTTKGGKTYGVYFDGPFFKADPLKTLAENELAFMTIVAAEGERDAKAQLESAGGRMRRWTGWTYDTVRGRVVSVRGKHWRKTAVISTYTANMDAKDAIRTKAAGAAIEKRFHVFRRTATMIRKAATFNFTKGME